MASGDSVKDMTSKFDKLNKFEGQDFRRWQKKMHFLLTTLKVVYVLSTPMPVLLESVEDEPLEATRRRSKWENDDYICRGHILNGMSDSLFDIYQNFESAKELWDSLESKYMAEDASSKKFLVSNFMGYKMIDSRPVMEQFHEMLRILGQFAQHNLKMDEAISVAVIIDKLPPSWKDFKHNLKHNKEELTLTQLGSHLRIEESLRTQELDNNPRGKNQVGSSSVNMVDGEGSKNQKKSNGKRKFKGKDDKSSNKKAKVVCWNCNKPGHFKKDCRLRKVNKDGAGPSGSKDPEKQQGQISVFMQNSKYIHNYNLVISEAFYVQDDNVARWVDSGATSHVCKDLYWFKDFQPINDGSVVKMGNVATGPIKGIGSVLLTFTSGKCLCLNNVLYVPGIRKNLVSEIVLNNCGYKQVLESDKQPFKDVVRESKVLDLIHSDLCDFHATPSLGNKKYVVTFIDDASRYCYVYLLHSKDEALDKFKIYKQQVELHKNELIKVLRTDRGSEYYDPIYFESTGIIHQTTAPYTPQQNGVAERKNRTLKEMVNSMLSYFGLSEGFWGEAMLTTCYILNRTPNKRSKNTPYELWCKKVPNLSYLKIWGCRAVVRLTKPKRKTLGERGIDCIFIGYAEHSKAYRFYVLESNDSVSVNTVIESRDAIFDEERFTSIPRPRDMIQQSFNKNKTQAGDDSGGTSSVPELRKSTRARKAKSFGSNFQLYLVEGTSKFDTSGKGVMICLYVDDMLIFGTDLEEVDKTKKFLSSSFDMKDMGEAEVILGIRIRKGKNGISISQSHYIEKILKKFNFENCSPVSTPIDPSLKLLPNKGSPVSQLEYSRAIGCLMYAMISTRPDIAYVVGRLSRYTSNPSSHHWQAVNRVFKYLKGTINYGLTYSGYPSVLEGYLDSSWINNLEDPSSTSGWVFLLGGGAISCASKKQTCITNSTMEYEFVALSAAGKEAEWLRNLIYEISLWPKPISTISIRCDSAATLAKAYSQVYNGKSRHLGVRHSMICELIMTGVISVEFVRTQLNLADHLTKGLARNLVHKAAVGMGLKST
uniref:Zinc finger, CCHC-type n=1 Tax=Lactuca sativa TaxID=4236 RepID=A0A9R1UL14_LACSA|nr:hypothetical protein LSAT_V11C800397780 [Lactuca sativa]